MEHLDTRTILLWLLPSAKQAGYLPDPGELNREILFMIPHGYASLTQKQGAFC